MLMKPIQLPLKKEMKLFGNFLLCDLLGKAKRSKLYAQNFPMTRSFVNISSTMVYF